MIISASRRTDIPAFFAPWFYNRICGGEVCVRNPVNPRQVSRIILSSETVECIVFWTKNPSREFTRGLPMLDGLGYPYYIHFTLTPYHQDIEKNLSPKREILDAFIALSKLIGRERIIWRYDPILINHEYTPEFHARAFSSLAEVLGDYTELCVISFIDAYRKIRGILEKAGIRELDEPQMADLAGIISGAASRYGIRVESCCEAADLSPYGIRNGSCIDGGLVSRIAGKRYVFRKDTSQRQDCGCVAGIDIGAYNTCGNGCIYCYANPAGGPRPGADLYDPASPLLCSRIADGDIIGVREVKMAGLGENRLFD